MATCLTLKQGLAARCRNQAPGVGTIVLANFGDLSAVTYNTTSDKISGITFDAGTSAFTFAVNRDSCEFTETVTINIPNGTKTFVPKLVMKLPGLSIDVRNTIDELGEATVLAFWKDIDAVWYCLGIVNGMDATTIETSSGVAADSFKGTTITLEGKEAHSYYELESWVYAADIAPILI
jgi:hypothetical protein